MSRPVVLYGASELGRDALSVFHALSGTDDAREVLGFVDDAPAAHGASLLSVPVLGGGDWLDGRVEEVEVLLTVGEPRVRRLLAERLADRGHAFATVVHPSVARTPWVDFGPGCLVMAGCTFTVEIEVGGHVVVNPGCTVAHDVSIGDYCYLSPGVNLAGRVRLLEGAYMGIGASVIPSCTVGRGAVVGAGAVVVGDVPDDRVVVGVPARDLRGVGKSWTPSETFGDDE